MAQHNARVFDLFGFPRLAELRWLSTGRTFTLFTSKPAVITDALADPRVSGLNAYVCVNPPRPDILERRKILSDTLFSPRKGQCTADSDVPEHILLPADLDPRRPTGTASMPEQVDLAVKQRDLLIEYLIKRGLPDPAGTVLSGNGAHGYHRTRLPNNEETRFLLTAYYTCLARRFGTAEVIFDKSVRSAAQLMRWPSSFNTKAQRYSSVQTFNSNAGLVTMDMLRAVTEDLRGQLGFKRPLIARQGYWTPELMERFLGFYHIDFLPLAEIAAGLLYVLNPCPLNDAHVGSSPAVLITKAGWPRFLCKHESCGGGRMKWKEFRARLFALTNKFFLVKGPQHDAE
ncbi:MAG: hypothetical protein ABSG08_15720 [Terriglobales bacterium]|jgi:hypothetical protein